MLEIEHLAESKTYDNIDYSSVADGMFEAFKILGIESEYIKWSFGK